MESWFVCVLFVGHVTAYFDNYTGDAAGFQLQNFKRRHPFPIGVQTTSAGEPVEIRNTITLNSDFLANNNHLDILTHFDGERIPERVVHAKGTAAFGYFEVTNDVSKYTKADLFNGIGKITPFVSRFSINRPPLGGSDLERGFRGLAVKFYTNEGNLDLTCLQVPVYLYKDPIDFPSSAHSLRRNPKTGLLDQTMQWEFTTLRASRLNSILWLSSDHGIPRNYRTADYFPIHTFEINNKEGERHFVRFNFRTHQGIQYYTSSEGRALTAEDIDHYNRDLYNAIAEKNYPSWTLEMDVMTLHDIQTVNYDPFDITRTWRNGTYHTVPIGRFVVNRHVSNQFSDGEQGAYNPGNLVPGIVGPPDFVFKNRRFSYRDTQNYRLGYNHHDIDVNTPKYAKTYNRDGQPPLRDNMRDAPNYFPNSFNGPAPFVDESKPREKLIVLESNAVDFEPLSYFYNSFLVNDGQRQRLADNLATSLEPVLPNVLNRALTMLYLVDRDLGRRVKESLIALRIANMKEPADKRIQRIAKCFERPNKVTKH